MWTCMHDKKTVESIQIERITPFRFASFPPMVRLRNAYKYIMCASPSKVRRDGKVAGFGHLRSQIKYLLFSGAVL